MHIRKLSALLSIVLTLLVAIWVGYAVQKQKEQEIVDCIWDSSARAWDDADRDGRWDVDERPLAGVHFFIDDVHNGFRNVGDEAVSDAAGEAKLMVWLPGCAKAAFEVYAQPPAGYRFTTPSRPGEEAEVFLFGLVAE